MFGSCFTTLAVILVSDFNFNLKTNSLRMLKMESGKILKMDTGKHLKSIVKIFVVSNLIL